MKQADLNRAVARATGETVSTIKRLGFLLADPTDSLDCEADGYAARLVDWEDVQAQRFEANTWRPHDEPVAV